MGGQKGMETLTTALAYVSPVRLPGWGPRNSHKRWLETIDVLISDVLAVEICIVLYSPQSIFHYFSSSYFLLSRRRREVATKTKAH